MTAVAQWRNRSTDPKMRRRKRIMDTFTQTWAEGQNFSRIQLD
jgi:hypothetical protein